MSASGSRGMLTMATRHLQARWAETRNSWRDQKAADFEDTYLAELATSVNSALRVLEDLDHLLDKIHADCD
jgi:hypothetical protein